VRAGGVYSVYVSMFVCVGVCLYIYIQLYDGSFARRVTGNHVMSPVFRQETNFGSRNDGEGFRWRGRELEKCVSK